MQAPTVNRNTGNVIAPEATARADNPSNLRQQTEQPTQRSSHSLGSMGKRLLKSVGKVFRNPGHPGSRPPDRPVHKHPQAQRRAPVARLAETPVVTLVCRITRRRAAIISQVHSAHPCGQGERFRNDGT
ncbi:AvrE-family type 3 secretion system effector [Pseudomonas syringae]|nr:AvrE-family type 3 secretion system effector [Pseudomonas syringae]